MDGVHEYALSYSTQQNRDSSKTQAIRSCAGTRQPVRNYQLLEVPMPKYYFDIKNGHRLIDSAGFDCKDDGDAVAKGSIIAKQVATDGPKPSTRKVAVLDSNRHEVGQADIKEKDGPGGD
jgi:hypothetical protein